ASANDAISRLLSRSSVDGFSDSAVEAEPQGVPAAARSVGEDFAERFDADFDPEQFLDREDERSRFRELLLFTSARRLLAIRASGGSGKSELLRWFEWDCDAPDGTRGPMPVSRVSLDQVRGGRVVDLVYQIRTDLDTLDWSSFEAVRKRWL